MNPPVVELKPGREKSVLARHPWIFSGAVASQPEVPPGKIVDVYSHSGQFLARGALNPHSQIRVRVFTLEPEPIDTDFFKRRLTEARDWRKPLLPLDTNCCRVCFSEGDFLPGLIIDDYDGFAVMQILTSGAEAKRDAIIQAMEEVLDPKGLFERSDSGFRIAAGLEKRCGPISGETPPGDLEVRENGMTLLADIAEGQKTGLYLDQRDSRRLLSNIAEKKTVLNAFSFSCAFGVAAMAGGATRTLNVDTSASALEQGKRTYEANDFPVREEDFVRGDVFDFLRSNDDLFDIVILDPPAFSKSQASVPRALRGYKEILMQGLKHLVPGGRLLAFSCSGHVDSALFQKVIFGAALDVKRDVQLLAKIGHSFDHPINIYHPEGEYLCGFLMRAAG